VNITPIIRELLLRNQKAVIPGFGAFTIFQRPAQLNKLTHILTPPSNEIRFDSSQQTDDGQLSGYLVQKNKQNMGMAIETIGQFLKIAEDQFSTKGFIPLESMGVLTREKSGDITFKPDEELLKRANFLELPKLNIPVAPQVSPASVSETHGKHQVAGAKKKRRWWIPAASIALLIGLLTVAYFTGIVDSFLAGDKITIVGSKTKADSGKLVFGNRGTSGSKQNETDTLKEKISRELDERTARENALLYKEGESEPTEKAKQAISEPVQPALNTANKAYYIIAGAFLVPNNAGRQKLQLERKGFSPVLLPKRGNYYMVSLGSYDSHEQAVIAMRQLRRKLEQELWVMKM
jgi:hypothetical protein